MPPNKYNLSRTDITFLRHTPHSVHGNSSAVNETFSRLRNHGLITKSKEGTPSECWVRTNEGHEFLRSIHEYREEGKK